MRPEFTVHLLNSGGLDAVHALAEDFSDLLNAVEARCGTEGREMAIVRTHLQEACFFAKRSLALRPENQKVPR